MSADKKQEPDNENLGRAIDRLENIAFSLNMNLPCELHLKAIREAIPEIVKELKAGFVEATGENPLE